MATTLAILVFALLITGVATATVYALPVIQQVIAAQTQNGEMMQSQQRLQFRECIQNCECTCEGTCTCNQIGSETANGETYQNQLCEQTCEQFQYRYRHGIEEEA